MLSTTCSKCGAIMEINLEHIQVYCPYCGNKLSIDLDKLNDVLIEKEKTRQKEIEKERDLYLEKAQTERTKLVNKKDNTKAVLSFIGGIIKTLLIVIAIGFVAFVAFGFMYETFSGR